MLGVVPANGIVLDRRLKRRYVAWSDVEGDAGLVEALFGFDRAGVSEMVPRGLSGIGPAQVAEGPS